MSDHMHPSNFDGDTLVAPIVGRDVLSVRITNITLIIVSIAVLSITMLIAFYINIAYSTEVKGYDPPLELFALGIGALGAFLGILQRAYKITLSEFSIGRNFPTIPSLISYTILVLFPVFIGSIVGFVTYLFLASQIIKMSMLPQFECKPPGEGCNNFFSMAKYWCPKTSEDYLKTFLFCFFAGFFGKFFVGDVANFMESLKNDEGIVRVPPN